jgi:hypothetical protein
MGQVWSSANFDGTNFAGFQGGRGSVLAVTSQNPGADGIWNTSDDLLTPLNQRPADVSIDWKVGPDSSDPNDRVRGFLSQHQNGAVFALGDASTRFIPDTIDPLLYRQLSTRNGGEVIGEF